MNDAFDKDVAKRMPKTKPRRPWDVKPKRTMDTQSIDRKTIDKQSIVKSPSVEIPDMDYIDKHILPTLDPKAQLVYMKLYLLSSSFQRDSTDFIGYTALAKQCNMSSKSVYRAIKNLLNRRLISIIEHDKSKGTKYHVVATIDNPF